MKYVLLLVMTMCSACASLQSPPEDSYNYVSHERLGPDFVREKNIVCGHFKKTTEMLVLRPKYLAKYYEQDKEVEKVSRFEVLPRNVKGWHCGETYWKISKRMSEETALGRDVPLKY